MQIIIFSVPNFIDEELESVTNLLKENIIFHLRKPEASFDDLVTFIKGIPEQYHSKIVVHQYIKLLSIFNLKGFHCTRIFLNKQNNSIAKIRQKYSDKSFSKSCHTLAELDNIREFDYVFLSPIFDSISKSNYPSKFILSEIESKLTNTNRPIFALGGIKEDNIELLVNSKFSGIAVLGYIWNSNTPLINLKKLLSKQ